MNIHEDGRSILGRSSESLRQRSQYDAHSQDVRKGLLNESVTPPVGHNLVLLSRMESIKMIAHEFNGRPIQAAILGLATEEGVIDFKSFTYTALQTTLDSLHVVEIDSDMVDKVARLEIHGVNALHRDARHTGLDTDSQDVIVRDHLGNCCPPAIDRDIDREVARILKKGGISIVNITTSEQLPASQGRVIIRNDQIPKQLAARLANEVYDLDDISDCVPQDFTRDLEGKLLEIEKDGSFAIFAEETRDGEWFRGLHDHTFLWSSLGFKILEIRSRIGTDSHTPPLACVRHNVVMRKE